MLKGVVILYIFHISLFSLTTYANKIQLKVAVIILIYGPFGSSYDLFFQGLTHPITHKSDKISVVLARNFHNFVLQRLTWFVVILSNIIPWLLIKNYS